MFSSKTSRWFGLLILVMLGLRIGYKYYRTQQKPDYQTQMQEMTARQDDLCAAHPGARRLSPRRRLQRRSWPIRPCWPPIPAPSRAGGKLRFIA
ncbi:MAG: hypothetical protein WKG07_01520 [Hymenobacter sp.]